MKELIFRVKQDHASVISVWKTRSIVLPEHFSDEMILDEWSFFYNDRNSQGGAFYLFLSWKELEIMTLE